MDAVVAQSATGFHLPFSAADLPEIAAGYEASPAVLRRENALLGDTRQQARSCGWLSRDLLLALVRWKSPRALGRAVRNSDSDVVELTRMALSARTERGRITALRGLEGIDWPMASVILHACHPDPYPILDTRALGTLGLSRRPAYSFDLWIDYTEYCRTLAWSIQEVAEDLHEAMILVDRALWSWSKRHDLVAA